MTKASFRLNGNQLKLIAMVAMTADHVGLQLLPQWGFLRILGRLAMPLYAYMIAEGCRYTRSRGRYFGSVALMGLGCQIVYFFFMGSLYQCILVTFSLSIGLIYLMDRAQGAGKIPVALVGTATVWFLTEMLPGMLPATDFCIDYDFWGVMLPVLVYCAKDKRLRLALTAVCLGFLGNAYGWVQWFALGAVPLLALYNGQRGKWKGKYLFYIYYPVHLVILHFLGMLLR